MEPNEVGNNIILVTPPGLYVSKFMMPFQANERHTFVHCSMNSWNVETEEKRPEVKFCVDILLNETS